MASGVGLVNSNSFKGFDFASCSFKQESGDKLIPDLETSNEFNKLDEPSYKDIFSLVEKCMKKHTDDIISILQGISSRLSNLELYCYNVDKSVGEIGINLGRDYEETDARLKSLDKHLEEVSQSVQILREKQELAETQKLFAKLQLAQKGTSSPNVCQHNVERSVRSTSPASDYHETDDTYEVQNEHLAIVLHNEQQSVPQQQMQLTRPAEVAQHVVPSSQAGHQHMTQPQHIYLTPTPYQVQVQASQGQYSTSAPQYLEPNVNFLQLQQVPAQVSQAPPQIHHFIQYQPRPQQPQQILTTQVHVQQPIAPVLSRPQPAFDFSPQHPSQFYPQAPLEAMSTSVHMHSSFPSMPQKVVNSENSILRGYSGGSVQQHSQPQQVKEILGAHYGDAYTSMVPHHSFSPATPVPCMMYFNEEVKRQSLPQCQFSQGDMQFTHKR